MSKYVFEKASTSLSNVEIQKIEHSKGFKIWLIFTILMGSIFLCTVLNENFTLLLYDEIIKFEIGGIIIDSFNNLLSPNDNIFATYNGLWRIKPEIRDIIEVKKNTVVLILLMANLMNVGIGAIIFDKDGYETNEKTTKE